VASISAIRDGLKARLETIAGLRVYDTAPDQMVVPCAIVLPPTLVAYDQVFARGADRYEFPIRVYVSRLVDRAAQDALDGYLSGTGSTSVKTALEEPPRAAGVLGGVAQACTVTRANGYGVYTIGNAQYLGSEWLVEVYA